MNQEKISKIEIYIGSFFLVSSIIGLTGLYMNYANNMYSTTIKDKIEGIEYIAKYNFEIERLDNSLRNDIMDSNYVILNKKLSDLIENQQHIITQLEEIKLMKNSNDFFICNHVPTTTSISSMSSFTPTKINNTFEGEDEAKYEGQEKNKGKNEDEDYDEILNECYDNIPLNNLKKNTALSWVFNI